MVYKFSFERLEVWQLSRKLAKLIYEITSLFPDNERYCLVSQMRRSAVSVASNLAEGCSRNSGKDQARFSELAYGSLMELLSQIFIALDLGFIDYQKSDEIQLLIIEIGNKINSLKKYQSNKPIN